MTYAVRTVQARCAALGFDPGPIDGIMGRRTRAAMSDATASQGARKLPFVHPSGLSRIHIHWTAGASRTSRIDREHYHVLVEQDGSVFQEHNPTKRLAHTLNANGGAIAVSACGMLGSTERPWNLGLYPLKESQMFALERVVADLCVAYDIPVSRTSVLTHAEVQPTLGIKQRGKRDFDWLPGMEPGPHSPIAVGDKLRARIAALLLS